MSESTNVEISPHDCMPFLNIRKNTKSGVLRIATLFTKKSKTHFTPCGAGITFESGTPIVVQITPSMMHVGMDYFRSQGASRGETKQKIDSKATWYGIEDEVYKHAVLRFLTKKNSFGQHICGM